VTAQERCLTGLAASFRLGAPALIWCLAPAAQPIRSPEGQCLRGDQAARERRALGREAG